MNALAKWVRLVDFRIFEIIVNRILIRRIDSTPQKVMGNNKAWMPVAHRFCPSIVLSEWKMGDFLLWKIIAHECFSAKRLAQPITKV